jgi:UDPglucose 6-dehydrogenase
MRVCVFGLWHLGTVTAACLASIGHDVVGLDFDPATVERLGRGEPPLHEPGLGELVQQGLDRHKLRFTTDPSDAVKGARVLWVTFDTPVDEDDRADVEYVTSRVESMFEHLDKGTLVIVSSQLPAGSVLKLEAASRGRFAFASAPENLRLGKAIDLFLKPDRVVAGVRKQEDRAMIEELLEPLHARIEWMSVESAEMTKHALNAFLATSVAFINEIAVVCEQVGADAQEVARGLKSDARIGPRAYLSPGGAFAGGTLARDIEFLKSRYEVPLIASVKTSNDRHKDWTKRKLESVLGPLRGRTIAIWGLTYKPGTDTLRRSSSVELCQWLLERGVRVKAHDPMVHSLPEELSQIELCADPGEALRDAGALVVSTEWPEYKTAPVRKGMIVIDANRFLASREGLRYFSVGMPAT